MPGAIKPGTSLKTDPWTDCLKLTYRALLMCFMSMRPSTPVLLFQCDSFLHTMDTLTDYLHTASGLDVNTLLLTGKQHMCVLQCEA